MSSTRTVKICPPSRARGCRRLDVTKRIFLLLDNFLQEIHRHTFPDVDGEMVVGYIENLTRNSELIKGPRNKLWNG